MSEHEYELLERIGIGGMAEVFRANALGAEGFSRPIAIKRILPHLAEDTDFVTMFIDEAKIAVQLSHPNIVGIFDLGRFGDDYFIAMELVYGKDLRQILDREQALGRRVPLEVALHATMKMCEALHHAHFKGGPGELGERVFIIHRDVSPQNVLISFDGQVKVTDFGLAKAAGRAVQTQAGIIKGKLAYMSPEQLTTLPIDQRSDVFGVGILLWELLTGARLFLGKNDRETIQNVYNAHVPPPSTLDPAIPPELERIVMRALAKNRDERYTTAQQLADDLEELTYSIGAVLSGPSLAAYMRELFPQVEASGRKRDPRAVTAEIRLSEARNPSGERAPEPRAGLDGSTSGRRSAPMPPPAPIDDPYGIFEDEPEEIDDGGLLEADDSDEAAIDDDAIDEASIEEAALADAAENLLESLPPGAIEEEAEEGDPEESRKTIPPVGGGFSPFDDATPSQSLFGEGVQHASTPAALAAARPRLGSQPDEISTSIQPARVVRATFAAPSEPPLPSRGASQVRPSLADPQLDTKTAELGAAAALAAQYAAFDDSFDDRTTFGAPEPFQGAPPREPSIATYESPVDAHQLFSGSAAKITLESLEAITTGQGRLPPEEMLTTRAHHPSPELIARSREERAGDRAAPAPAVAPAAIPAAGHRRFGDDFDDENATMVGSPESFGRQPQAWEDETTPVGDSPRKKQR